MSDFRLIFRTYKYENPYEHCEFTSHVFKHRDDHSLPLLAYEVEALFYAK